MSKITIVPSDPRKEASFQRMSEDEKMEAMDKFMEEKDQFIGEAFRVAAKELEEAQEEAAKLRLSAKTTSRVESEGKARVTEPARLRQVFEEGQERMPVFGHFSSRRQPLFAPVRDQTRLPAPLDLKGLFSTPSSSSGSASRGASPSTLPSSSGSVPAPAPAPAPVSSGGGGPAPDLNTAIETAIRALGPVLGAAMQQQQLPKVVLKSFSKNDIEQFVKDHEAYVAVGGPKRMSEFLGGTQLQTVKDALEAEGEVVTYDQLRLAPDEQLKVALFFLHRSTSHSVTTARLSSHKMADDSAEFSVYQRYKRDFEFEVQLAGTDFVLPPDTMAKMFVKGLRPLSLSETVKSLAPKTLSQADQYTRQLLPQEQAFVARIAKEKYRSGKDPTPVKNPMSESPGPRPPDPNSKTSMLKAAKAAARAAAQDGTDPGDTSTSTWNPQCYGCGEYGHIKPMCPNTPAGVEPNRRNQIRVEPDSRNPFKPPGVPVLKTPSKKSVTTVQGREEKADEEKDLKRITALQAEREAENREAERSYQYGDYEWHDRPTAGNRS